jgi:hypothetical protein
MTTSESVNEIAAALAKAQSAMKNAPLNKVNPHFKSKFADLASVRDAVIPALTANGIAVVQTLDATIGGDSQHFVVTRLMHASGQWVESLCPIPNGGDMQKMGSAITYARRYSLSAICGIAADEDDDANAVAQPPSRPQAVSKTPEGFDNWLTDLEAVADSGTAALQAAWTASQPYLRKHLTDTNAAKWEALKAKAARVKVAVNA